MSDERALPHSIDAERAVLGAVLVENAALLEARAKLTDRHFYRESHRLLFGGMTHLADAGTPIDPVTLKEEMVRSGKLEHIGGPAYIDSLLDGAAIVAHVAFYADIVREKALDRDGLLAIADLQEAVYSRNGDPAGVNREPIDLARRKVREALDAQEAPPDEELRFADLAAPLPDAPIALVGDAAGIFIPQGQKVLATSESGVGKTHLFVALALGIASETDVLGFKVSRGTPVLYASSDDDPDVERKFQRHARGLGMSLEELAALPLRVVNDAAFNLDAPGSVAKVRKALLGLRADKQPVTLIIESLTTNIDPTATDIDRGPAVRAYIRRTFSALQAEFAGLTCIVSHHFKKTQQGSGNDLSSRISHSAQIKAGFDVVLGLVGDGDEAFKVRTLKRSRSGAKFEPFRVRIVGAPDAPLSLVNDGTLKPSDAEVSGAAGAVLAYLKSAPGPRSIKEILLGTQGVKKRAIERACAKLSEGSDARLVRSGKKPAKYALVSADSTENDAGDID